MNLDTDEGLDDSVLFDDPEIAGILMRRRRTKPLGSDMVKKLVTVLKVGRDRRGNIEKYGDRWRLRFSIRDGKGGAMRRSIVITDPDTAAWIQNAIKARRRRRLEYKHSIENERVRNMFLAAQARGASLPRWVMTRYFSNGVGV